MRFLHTILAEDHAYRHAGPVDAFAQGAQVRGDDLGKHRHHAIGEIDGIAPCDCFAVESGARAHAPGDVGDGDDDNPAVLVGGIGVGRSPDRIVMIAGVGGVDCDEGHLPQILPTVRRRNLQRIRFAQDRFGEGVAQPVLVDGDQADRPLSFGGAAPLRHTRALDAIFAPAGKLEAHQFPIFCLTGVGLRHRPLFQMFLVHRIDNAAAIGDGAKYTEELTRLPCQPLDRFGLV